MKRRSFLLTLCLLVLGVLVGCGGQLQQSQTDSFTGVTWRVQEVSGIPELAGVPQNLVRMASVRFRADGSGSISALVMNIPVVWQTTMGGLRLEINGAVYGPVSYTVDAGAMELAGSGIQVLLVR